jgi:hypothetical protein
LGFGKTEIFLRRGLDRVKPESATDLPAGRKFVVIAIIGASVRPRRRPRGLASGREAKDLYLDDHSYYLDDHSYV